MNTAFARLLRTETRPWHQQLDSHPLLQPLASPQLSLPQYQCALAALYPPQRELEHSVLHALRQQPQLDYRLQPRATLLAADLNRLDVPIRAAADNSRGDLVLEGAALIGALYVLEGSRLGAALIRRNVHANLGPQTPSCFLEAADPGHHWPRFWQLAAQYQSPAEQQAAVEGAIRAFQHYLGWMAAAPRGG